MKTLFLDRDGVINVNHGYVYQKEKFEFIEGIFTLCRQAQKKGYQIIIITNQSGIAREYYSQDAFKQLSKWLEHQFWKQGIKIRQTLHCPHHPEFSHHCSCRKPKPGMVFKAKNRFGINLKQSILVGDSLSDMVCARTAGIKKNVLFKPHSPHQVLQYPQQHSRQQTDWHRPELARPGFKPYYQARSLRAICKLL